MIIELVGKDLGAYMDSKLTYTLKGKDMQPVFKKIPILNMNLGFNWIFVF
jgi:hypothetical protein